MARTTIMNILRVIHKDKLLTMEIKKTFKTYQVLTGAIGQWTSDHKLYKAIQFKANSLIIQTNKLGKELNIVATKISQV